MDSATRGLKIIGCLAACSFNWAPFDIYARCTGRVLHPGVIGCVAYSLLCVGICVLALTPAREAKRPAR